MVSSNISDKRDFSNHHFIGLKTTLTMSCVFQPGIGGIKAPIKLEGLQKKAQKWAYLWQKPSATPQQSEGLDLWSPQPHISGTSLPRHFCLERKTHINPTPQSKTGCRWARDDGGLLFLSTCRAPLWSHCTEPIEEFLLQSYAGCSAPKEP